MRVFATSDLHVDYDENAEWVRSLSHVDHVGDILVVAGDVSDTLARLAWCLSMLKQRFREVLFVPGNHDLWVVRSPSSTCSLQKFDEVRRVALDCGATLTPLRLVGLTIVPLLGWYDGSFGVIGPSLSSLWSDFMACRWPSGWTPEDVAAHFDALNPGSECRRAGAVITFSHFLPRTDVMPAGMPASGRHLYPVLGSTRLEERLRMLGSQLHIYGHSHINRDVVIDGVRYVNNALAYPHETWPQRRLRCLHEIS